MSISCPNCGSTMKRKDHPDVTTDVCPSCDGVFLDKGELNAMAGGMAGDIECCSIDAEGHADRFGTRVCPKCPGQEMRKINLLRFSNLIFDYCSTCGGFFCDRGEIESMNVELAELLPAEESGEFRFNKNDHLVRINQVNDIMMLSGPLETSAQAKPVTYVQVEVYFKKPLNIGLKIHAEKWVAKLAKILGLFWEQDIVLGNKKFDAKFVVQTSDEEKARKVVSKQVQDLMLEFVSKKASVLSETGSIEVLDNRIVYTEGPYTGEIKTDLKQATAAVIVDDLLRIAALI